MKIRKLPSIPRVRSPRLEVILQERRLTRDERVNLLYELLLLLGLETVVPLGEAGFACAILDQDELDRHRGQCVVPAGHGGEGVGVRDRAAAVPGAREPDLMAKDECFRLSTPLLWPAAALQYFSCLVLNPRLRCCLCFCVKCPKPRT